MPQKLGYGHIQPFCHYSYIDVDKEKDPQVYGFGFNYYIKGYANKITAEVTFVDQKKRNFFLKKPHIIHISDSFWFLS